VSEKQTWRTLLGEMLRNPRERQQVAVLRAAVVIEHRLDPLLPLSALMRQRVAQTHPGTEVEDVPRRDPRLRQPPCGQQLADMACVRAIGLRAPVFTRHRDARGMDDISLDVARPQPARQPEIGRSQRVFIRAFDSLQGKAG